LFLQLLAQKPHPNMNNESKYLIPVFDVMPLPCIILNVDAPHFTVKDVNKAFETIANICKKELIGHHESSIFVYENNKQNEASKQIIHSANTAITTKQIHSINNIKLNIRKYQNKFEYWTITHSPILDINGEVSVILQSFTNTTATSLVNLGYTEAANNEEKNLQDEVIHRIKNNQAALINSTDDIIFSIDKNFKLVTINTSYQQLLFSLTGRLEKEGDEILTGRLGQALTDKWRTYFERAFKGEKFSVQEAMYNPFKGYKQYGLINFNPVNNQNGEVESVACFAKDITDSTISYLALEKSKNELDKIFSASLDVICAVDQNNVFVKVSPASKTVWGYEPEEMIGHSIFEFIHPDYTNTTLTAISSIKTSATTINFENKYIKKDGSIATIEWNSSWDAIEQLRYGVARDITQKKKNEIELIESNLRYNYVTKATSDAIYDWDLENDSIFVGDVFSKIFGWTIDEIKAKREKWTELIHPDEREKIANKIIDAINNNANKWRIEYRFLKSNGDYAYVIDRAYILRNTNGKAVRIVGSKRDVTERNKELLRLKLLESAITNTNDIVVISEAESYDASGPRIIYVNEAFTTLTGYLPSEVIGKTPRIIQGPKTDIKELERLKYHMDNFESCELTLINYKKNGEEYWVNLSVNPVADENGKVTHWVSLQRDVTDKKQQEINMMKAIIKTQEDERYEVGGELHDNVCQILTSSQISLKMLKKNLPENDQYRLNEALEFIALATHEIRNLSHRLAPAFFADTTIEEAFTNLVRTFNIENDFHITIHFDDAFKQQFAKREFQLNMYRILQEQLKNILKHALATTINVIGKVENETLKIEVIDNGIGFDINNVKNGIGIANMKRRTELFSGNFNIQSTIGRGCTLTVEVPVTEIV
jgi:PAS domain S-box-containing protein